MEVIKYKSQTKPKINSTVSLHTYILIYIAPKS